MTIHLDLTAALELVSAHPDYKVSKRITPRQSFAKSDGRPLLKGVVVDTETTGTNAEVDAIIELGMVLFQFDPQTGQAFEVLGVFDELEDPGFAISEVVTAIHGITNEMVSGKRIDDAKVVEFLSGVSLVIAHNAQFDRVFLEKRLPIFATLPWGCSYADIDWADQGIGSAKLDYIAYQYGLFYEAHRAQEDCFALLEVLQQTLPKSECLVLKALLEHAQQKSYTIHATGAPFETKDFLKNRGYRWNATQKCWHTNVVGDEAIKSEAAWLKEQVYANKPAKIEIEVLNSLTRFSNRAGKKVIKEI